MGTMEERRFFHSFRTVVASNGLTNHVANRSRLWDELAPALGHEDNAVKHSLVALGAACHAYVMKREGGNGRYIRELDIFTIQQYNEAISSLIREGSTDGAAMRTRQIPTERAPPRRDPMRHVEVILFCCLTFIGIENLRGNHRGALNHLFNGLRIIESELPYSLIATLRGPPGMATTTSPSQISQSGRKAKFGVFTEDQKPSAFLLSMLAIFSRYEVSATFFSANFHPTLMLRLFCPTPRRLCLPVPEAQPEYSTPLPPPALPASSPAPLVREDGAFKLAQASPKSPVIYTNFRDAHIQFTVLAREIYALAHSLRSRRGDESFWGPSLLPLDAKSLPSPNAPHTSDKTYPSPSEAALVQYSILKARLAEMHLGFIHLISSPMAPLPGTKDWRSIRLDLLHSRCCDIHLKTLMFRRGAGHVLFSDLGHGEHGTLSPPSWNSSSSSSPSDKTTEKDYSLHSGDTQMSQVICSLQQDFAYLITIAEEIQGICPTGTQLSGPGMSCYSATAGLSPTTAAATPQTTKAPSPTSLVTGAHLGPSPSPPVMNMHAFPSPQFVSQATTATRRPKPSPPPSDAAIARFTVDLGVVTPMSLAALNVKDKSLRSRALAVMRSANSLEGFWDGVALADLLEKLFSIIENDGDDDKDDKQHKRNGDAAEKGVMEVLTGTTRTATETMILNTERGKRTGEQHHGRESSALSDQTMVTEAGRSSSSSGSSIGINDWKREKKDKSSRIRQLLDGVATTSSGGTSILDLMELMKELDIN